MFGNLRVDAPNENCGFLSRFVVELIRVIVGIPRMLFLVIIFLLGFSPLLAFVRNSLYPWGGVILLFRIVIMRLVIWWFLIFLSVFEIFVFLIRVLMTLMIIWLVKLFSVLELQAFIPLT